MKGILNPKLHSLRRKMLEMVVDNEDGLTFHELWDKVGGDKKDVLDVLDSLINASLIYIKGEKYYLGFK